MDEAPPRIKMPLHGAEMMQREGKEGTVNEEEITADDSPFLSFRCRKVWRGPDLSGFSECVSVAPVSTSNHVHDPMTKSSCGIYFH